MSDANNRRVRVLIEIDIMVTDPSLTDAELLDNLPDHFIAVFDDAERMYFAATGSHGQYQTDTADLTVWTSHEDYMTERKARADAAQVAEFATRTLPGTGVKGYV